MWNTTERNLIGGIALGALLNLNPVTPQPVHADAPAPSASAPAPTQAASDVDAALTGILKLRPTVQPLSAMLQGIQAATGVPLSRADSAPDDAVFSASSDIEAKALLRQMRLLLTDAHWQYQWAHQSLGKGRLGYRLWRQPVDPAQCQAFLAQQAKDRLAMLLADIQAGQQAWDQIAQQDEGLGEVLNSPWMTARVQLLSTLSPNQLNAILAGQKLTFPVASLSADQQRLIRAAANGRVTTVTFSNGTSRYLFNSDNLANGRVVFQAIPSETEPGALSIGLCINTEPDAPDGPGSDVLYPDTGPEPVPGGGLVDRRQKSLADAAPGSDSVTIPADEKAAPGEPPLGAYLGDLARQTKLTVLAFWPQGDPTPQKRLPQSIVNQPIAQALETLCAVYQCDWVQDGSVVRIRPRHIVRPSAAGPNAATAAP